MTIRLHELLPRRDTDTDLSYERLCDYSQVHPSERKVKHLAKRWGVKYGAAHLAIQRGDFRQRVLAYDDAMAEATTTAMRESVHEHTRDLVKTHVEMWADVRDIGRKALDRILENDGEDLSPTQALAFLEAAFKAERLLQGAATEHVAVAVRALDTSSLSMEELREMSRLLHKCGAG